MTTLTPERLAKITKELQGGKIANYPGLIQASHEALRAERDELRKQLLLEQLTNINAELKENDGEDTECSKDPGAA